MPTESLEATEKLGARDAKAPRVTLGDIVHAIKGVYYVNAGQAVRAVYDRPSAVSQTTELNTLTICLAVLENGFVVIGKSAPASAANFDEEKGRNFAYEDAARQIWPLMGFALRERLHKEEKG